MNIKLHLVRTKNTSILCVACGKFGADHVVVLADGSETDYGCHRKCAPMLHVKRTRKVVEHAAE
jgi:hypothetical protein